MVLFKIAGGMVEPEIEMNWNETIFDLKHKIEEVLGVPMDRQSLWYDNCPLDEFNRDYGNLRDDEFIEDHCFHRFTTLNLVVNPLPQDLKFHVMVKSDFGHNRDYVKVRETDKVSDLRRKVERRWAIPLQLFTLSFLGVEMKDNHPLHAYYVTEDSEIQLLVKIQPR